MTDTRYKLKDTSHARRVQEQSDEPAGKSEGNPAVVAVVLEEAIQQLATTSPGPRLDAEILLMHVCGLSSSELITRGKQLLTGAQLEQLQHLLEQRVQGEPIAYLTGRREFWSLEFKVTPATLIPRPETELLVERALARIPEDTRWTVADPGTGCGAIALAIASERRRCRVIATDASEDALAVARDNAQRLGLNRVEFVQCDWLAALNGIPCDLIASNPPYVAADDPHLQRGDVRFEPRKALAAGTDGLNALRAIISAGAQTLRPGGWLLVEHGLDQGGAVGELMRRAGYQNMTTYKDLAKLDRVTEGRCY